METLDYLRAVIPAGAFVGWTMIQQKPTAFDAVFDDANTAARFLIPAVAALVLGALASALAYKADGSDPGA